MSKVTVIVNGLTLVHQGSGATSTATLPDVCLTPPSNEPTPYVTVAEARTLAGGTTTVHADGGSPIAVAGSTFARSTGDEAGRGGGITSGTTGAEAALLSHSFDVAFEGRGAARLTDKMLHNHGNTIDCAGLSLEDLAADAKGGDRLDLKRPDPKATPKPPDKIKVIRAGCDTNLGDYAPGVRPQIGAAWLKHARKMTFIGRYISQDLIGNHYPLTLQELEEIHGARLAVVLIWEVTKFQAVCQGTKAAQKLFGESDAAGAVAWLQANGQEGKNRVVYFTCDFPTHAHNAKKSGPGSLDWDQPPPQPAAEFIPPEQPWIPGVDTVGDLIEAYFQGIKTILNGIERIGVYGAQQTISMMVGKHAKYGWQWAMPPETPPPTPKSPFPYGNYSKNMNGNTAPDFRAFRDANILQYQIYPNTKDTKSATSFPRSKTGVYGAGSLDLDAALTKDFGQIEPPH